MWSNNGYQLYRHLGCIFNIHWLIEFQARITKLYRLLTEQLCIINSNNVKHWKPKKFGLSSANFVGSVLLSNEHFVIVYFFQISRSWKSFFFQKKNQYKLNFCLLGLIPLEKIVSKKLCIFYPKLETSQLMRP